MLVTPTKKRPGQHSENKKAGFWGELRIKNALLSAAGVVAVLAILALLMKGEIKSEINQWAKSKGFGYIQKTERLRYALAQAPLNYLAATELPKMVLDVKFKNMQKIFKKRAEALEKKFLVQGKDDFVPVTIRDAGIDKKIKAKVRLKGDYVDHLLGNKWSFRVHTKGKSHFSGLRRFSVQHPKTRGFQQEPLFFELLRQLDLLAPRYSFVDLTINGKNIGVMAVEEHFSKELLETNGRKEGVIVRFDESIVFDARDGYERRMGLDGGAFDSYRNAPIDAFRTSKVLKSERLSRDYRYAVGMLRGFVQGKMKASDVFDVEQIGKLAAVADLWGAWHVLVWRNIRFYLNPLTMKLEPIAYDANHDDRGAVGKLVSHKSQLFSQLLKDPEIFNVYKKTILDLADKTIRGNLIESLKAKETVYLNQLHNEYYLLPALDYDYFVKQAKFISTHDFSKYSPLAYHYTETIKLNDLRDIDYPRILHAYRITGKKTVLELANAVPHTIKITKIQLKAKKSKYPDKLLAVNLEVKLPITLPPLEKGATPVFLTLPISPDADFKNHELEITAKIVGYKKIYKLQAAPYHLPIQKTPVPKPNGTSKLRKYRFVSVDEAKKTVEIKRGTHRVTENLIVPAKYTLIVTKGTTLQFSENAILLSYGPVRMIGSKDNPIILEPVALATDNNVQPSWQGMVVMNADGASRLEHVEFRNTKGILQGGWQLTGGVTFYESDVDIVESRFLDNIGEDALNIVHSNFDITGIRIERTASDAFDSDFSKGSFTGGLFKDIGLAGGGDGIDVSGSNIVVSGTRFIHVDDKALSVGEKSTMRAENVDIQDAGTGAASKDGSELLINNSHIGDVNVVGLMAYIKKPEYGGARIIANQVEFDPGVQPARAQRDSQIVIDGKVVKTENINVKEMYQTIMKPGLRR